MAHKLTKKVKEDAGNKESAYKEYGSYVMSLPILVRTAGLAGALEFTASRKPSQQVVLDHLKEHLQEAKILTGNQHLLEESRTADLSRYMRMTREVLAALVWHKRFAHSMLGVDPSEDRT